jgi:tetratricopeptide (TPR) repeat protein
MGSLDEAQTLLDEAVASRMRVLGALDPATLAAIHNLGNLHVARGDFARAAPLLDQAMVGRQLSLGAAHVDTLRSMTCLASALYEKGLYEPYEQRQADLDAALAHYRKALALCEEALGQRHPLTLTTMNNLGNILHSRSLAQPKFVAGRGPNQQRAAQLEESATLLRTALEQSRHLLGHSHLETLISSSNLGSCLRSMDDEQQRDEASQLIQHAVEGIANAWADAGRSQAHSAALRQGLEALGEEGLSGRASFEDTRQEALRLLEA